MIYVIAIVVVIAAAWLGHSISVAARFRKLPADELGQIVFCVPAEYFSYIGSATASVQEYIRLVECRDLQGLLQQWPRLEKEFRRAEFAAGHRGRPLIMDYFLDHRAAIRELIRRDA